MRRKSEETPEPRGGSTGVVLVPALAMLVVGVWGLGRGLWFDEAVTLEVSRRTLPQIWALTRHVDVVHGAYYAVMHVWSGAGGGEVWFRLPSVLAAVVSAALVAALGAGLAGRRAGLLAGLLFATLPFVSFYAQEARSYAMVGAAVLTGTWCLLRALESGGRWWVGYVAALATAQTLHELAVLVLLAHGVTLVVARVPRRQGVTWLGCAVVLGLLLLPLVLASAPQAGQVAWIDRPTWSSVGRLWLSFSGTAPVAVVVVTGLALLGTTAPARGRVSLAALALPLLLVPPAVLLLVSQADPLFRPRYVFFSVVAAPLLAGAGLDRLVAALGLGLPRRRRADLLALAVVAAVVAAELPSLRGVRSDDSRAEDLAGAARVVATFARPGDGVVFTRPLYRTTAMAYPEAFAGTADLTLAGSAADDGSLLGPTHDTRALRAGMLAAPRIWLLGRPALDVERGSHPAVDALRVLESHFRWERRYVLHGIKVVLYTRR